MASGRRITRMVLILALLAAGAMLGVLPAQADTVQFQITSDHCTGGCGTPPFGTVTLVQDGTTVDVTVHLNSPNAFIKSGAGDFQNFLFNGTGVALGDISVDQTVAGETMKANAGVFGDAAIGSFGFGIACDTCKNGSAGLFFDDIEFHVADATIADLTAPNSKGNIFMVDIVSCTTDIDQCGTTGGGTGNTGLVDVNGESPCIGCLPRVPEPGTLLLLGTGLGLLGALGWRRRPQ